MFCLWKFFVECHSSQLPEQKVGLFDPKRFSVEKVVTKKKEKKKKREKKGLNESFPQMFGFFVMLPLSISSENQKYREVHNC